MKNSSNTTIFNSLRILSLLISNEGLAGFTFSNVNTRLICIQESLQTIHKKPTFPPFHILCLFLLLPQAIEAACCLHRLTIHPTSIRSRVSLQRDFVEGSDRVQIGLPIRTLSQPYLNPISTLSEPYLKSDQKQTETRTVYD